jgi:hypothetical protein
MNEETQANPTEDAGEQDTSVPTKKSRFWLKREDDTNSYTGWLNSDSFAKRALAVYGYSAVGSILVSVAILLVVAVVTFVIGLSS